MDVAINLLSGQDFQPQYYNDKGYGTPYMTGASNINNGELSINRWTERPKNISSLGELLLVCKGSGYGKTVFNTIGDIHIARQFMAIRAYNKVDIKYINLFLLTKLNEIKKSGQGVIPGIDRKSVLNLLLPLPPYNEEYRIVQRFDEYIPEIQYFYNANSTIENYNNDFTSKLKASILQYAIQGKLVPQDPNDEPASVLLKRIHAEKEQMIKEGKIKRDKNESYIYRGSDNSYYEKNEIVEKCIDAEIPFDIPDSWQWVRHNELFEISGGAQPPKSKFSPYPQRKYIRLYQIRDYGKDPVPVYIPIETATKTTIKGDILLARYGASVGKVFWAEDGAYNVAMAKVIPLYKNKLISIEYLYLFYQCSIYQNLVKNNSRSAQAGFNKEDLSKLLFPLPPLEEQNSIVQAVNRYLEFIL